MHDKSAYSAKVSFLLNLPQSLFWSNQFESYLENNTHSGTRGKQTSCHTACTDLLKDTRHDFAFSRYSTFIPFESIAGHPLCLRRLQATCSIYAVDCLHYSTCSVECNAMCNTLHGKCDTSNKVLAKYRDTCVEQIFDRILQFSNLVQLLFCLEKNLSAGPWQLWLPRSLRGNCGFEITV